LDEEEATDWKCRYCNGYLNSAATEVCIQCNRARALCEQLSEEQKDEEKKRELQRKKKTKNLKENDLQRSIYVIKKNSKSWKTDHGHVVFATKLMNLYTIYVDLVQVLNI